MANSLALIGLAKVGSARLGWPADTTEPPATIRANGGCWGLVQDPGIVAAAQAAAEAKADAITKADAARDAAIAASTIIAKAKADTAESNATAAAATDAQTKANTAKDDAVAAAKIASDLAASGAKDEAIAAAEADATTKADAAREAAKTAAALDATAKANTAKADATTAAANDATAKANTAKSEAITAAAQDATAKAGQAKTDAVAEATTMTDGIGKNLSSTSVPTTTNKAPNGSIWRRTDSSGRIIGSWEQTGTGIAGTWTPRLLDSAMFDNVDTGKISASSGVINDLVAQLFAAKTASFQTVDIKNLFATTGTLAEAVINKLFTDVVKARISIADEFIGENAILTGSITAPKITASEELSAKLGEFLRVNTRMLEADAIDGMVITGAIFQSPGGGAGFQLTENGYTSRDADGNVSVRLPADGSTAQFRGDLEARSLTASGRVSFQAPENEITSGASVVLESGVQTPASPPNVGSTYPTIAKFPTPPERANVSGLAYAEGLWWRGVNALGTGEGDRIEGITSAGKVSVTTAVTVDPRGGIAAIGDELFVLGKRHDRPNTERWVEVYGVTGGAATYKRRWEYAYFGSGTYEPGIGVDGASLLISQCLKTGEATWANYDKTTGAQSNHVTSDYKLSADVAGIYGGNADFGTKRFVVSKGTSTNATSTFTPGGAEIGYIGSWYAAKGKWIAGLVWKDGKFYHLYTTGELVAYSSLSSADGDTNDWWLTQTFTGPGGKETEAGPAQRFTFMRRSVLRMSGGEMPPGVTGSKFYLAALGNTPGRVSYHLIAAPSGTSASDVELPSDWIIKAVPPASNTFANTDPGIMKSRIGGFVARGDGSGSWGPLTFHPDGTMTSAAVPSWVPVTSFATGFGAGGSGYVPAYRVWPDGKVEWRGAVDGTASALETIITVPSVALPVETVNWVGAATRNSSYPSGLCRIQIKDGLMRLYPNSGTLGFVSLDGLFYYLE